MKSAEMTLIEWSRKCDEHVRQRDEETAELMAALRRLVETEGPSSVYARCLAEIERLHRDLKFREFDARFHGGY
jgi:hypothetical protein